MVACQRARPAPAPSASTIDAAATTGIRCRAANFRRRYADAVRTRFHRLSSEVALDVVGQGGCARVALLGLVLQCVENDGVEVAVQLVPAAPVARRVARSAQVSREDLLLQRVRGGRSVQARSGRELEEHDSERVDVEGHSDGRSAQLLWRGIRKGQRAAGDLRQRGLFRGGLLAFDQLRNAEVEQLRLPVRRDEDVARLDVAVNDEPRVRIGHGAHDREEELKQ